MATIKVFARTLFFCRRWQRRVTEFNQFCPQTLDNTVKHFLPYMREHKMQVLVDLDQNVDVALYRRGVQIVTKFIFLLKFETAIIKVPITARNKLRQFSQQSPGFDPNDKQILTTNTRVQISQNRQYDRRRQSMLPDTRQRFLV